MTELNSSEGKSLRRSTSDSSLFKSGERDYYRKYITRLKQQGFVEEADKTLHHDHSGSSDGIQPMQQHDGQDPENIRDELRNALKQHTNKKNSGESLHKELREHIINLENFRNDVKKARDLNARIKLLDKQNMKNQTEILKTKIEFIEDAKEYGILKEIKGNNDLSNTIDKIYKSQQMIDEKIKTMRQNVEDSLKFASFDEEKVFEDVSKLGARIDRRPTNRIKAMEIRDALDYAKVKKELEKAKPDFLQAESDYTKELNNLKNLTETDSSVRKRIERLVEKNGDTLLNSGVYCKYATKALIDYNKQEIKSEKEKLDKLYQKAEPSINAQLKLVKAAIEKRLETD